MEGQRVSGVPRVSYFVPSYNYARVVAQAIDSLLGQTFDDMEVIVIDDASTDDTPAVLSHYAAEPRVRIVRHTINQGHIRTYNEGLALARGEFVGLLSADDVASDMDAVAQQVALFESHPDAGFVYSAFCHIDENGARFSTSQRHDHDYVRGGLDEFAELVLGNYVPSGGTLVRKRCHDELGGYDPELPHSGDS